MNLKLLLYAPVCCFVMFAYASRTDNNSATEGKEVDIPAGLTQGKRVGQLPQHHIVATGIRDCEISENIPYELESIPDSESLKEYPAGSFLPTTNKSALSTAPKIEQIVRVHKTAKQQTQFSILPICGIDIKYSSKNAT